MEILQFYQEHKWDIVKRYDAIRIYVERSGDILEGNCFTYHQSTQEFKDLLPKRSNILYHAKGKKRICEIGFNAGHSSVLLFQGSDPDAELLFFDLGDHAYMETCYEYVKSEFPQKKSNMIVGDSRVTVPRYLEENPDVIGTFDLVHVDGGHDLSCFTSDIEQAMKLVKKGGIVIVDDTQIPFIREWIEKEVRSSTVLVVSDQLTTFGYEHCVLQKR